MENFRPSGFNILPEAVKNLLIINGLFFLATYAVPAAFDVNIIRLLGLHYVESEFFQPYQFVTHLFMHGSFLHIFSNMFALWMFGSILENVWGPKRFLIFYFVTGLGAAALHTGVTAWDISSMENAVAELASNPSTQLFREFIDDHVPSFFESQFRQILQQWSASANPQPYINDALQISRELLEYKINMPTVGASGAVFGVLLAFGMLFPNTHIYLYFLFPVKAKYFVIFYGLFELWAGFQNNPGDNVAHFAHLGGMLFGFILIKFWNKNNRKDFY